MSMDHGLWSMDNKPTQPIVHIIKFNLAIPMICYVNGQYVELSTASVPVSDLGLQRGYGVFDFLRVKGSIPLFIDQHINRLFRSLDTMRLTIDYTKDQLKDIIKTLINKNQLEHSGIRITITGGASPDGYTPVTPHIMIVQQAITPPPDQLQSGEYKLLTHPYRRQLPSVKTTDYLMAIWLQPLLKAQGAQDVLYHWEGKVSECPRSNFFIVTKDNILVTPNTGMLNGVTRSNILSVANGLIPVQERDLTLDDIRSAKEAFISSSTKRIIPVTTVDDVVFDAYTSNSIAATLFGQLKSLEG